MTRIELVDRLLRLAWPIAVMADYPANQRPGTPNSHTWDYHLETIKATIAHLKEEHAKTQQVPRV